MSKKMMLVPEESLRKVLAYLSQDEWDDYQAHVEQEAGEGPKFNQYEVKPTDNHIWFAIQELRDAYAKNGTPLPAELAMSEEEDE